MTEKFIYVVTTTFGGETHEHAFQSCEEQQDWIASTHEQVLFTGVRCLKSDGMSLQEIASRVKPYEVFKNNRSYNSYFFNRDNILQTRDVWDNIWSYNISVEDLTTPDWYI